MQSDNKTAANGALKEALKALQRAGELCERADYGSQALGPLRDAQRDTQ